MKSGRFSIIILMLILLGMTGKASAGIFGFGGDDGEKSGIDFTHGYDKNTVTTVSGRVVALPQQDKKEQRIIGIQNQDGKINLALGPSWYWDKKGIPIHLNDYLVAKGAKAQGKDGELYLITQRLTNQTTDMQIELRSDQGDILWASRNSGMAGADSPAGWRLNQGFDMMRGGGFMMRH